jgi:hypothetical protein
MILVEEKNQNYRWTAESWLCRENHMQTVKTPVCLGIKEQETQRIRKKTKQKGPENLKQRYTLMTALERPQTPNHYKKPQSPNPAYIMTTIQSLHVPPEDSWNLDSLAHRLELRGGTLFLSTSRQLLGFEPLHQLSLFLFFSSLY